MTGSRAVVLRPGDLAPLRIDEALVRRMLVSFLRDETAKAGMGRVVIGLSGGVDSAVVAALAALAFGSDRVTALFTPYRTSAPASRVDARLVAGAYGIALEEIDITPQIDAYMQRVPEADRVRIGNKMARERKSIEYDRSWPDALVLGTSNKTELLLGYGTQFGDLASALNPIGDLYKTQVRELATELGVPAQVVAKAPSADLWGGPDRRGGARLRLRRGRPHPVRARRSAAPARGPGRPGVRRRAHRPHP